MAEKEKTLKTRILLKYDTLKNWNDSNGILKAGEVAIATYGNEDIKSNTDATNHKLGNPGNPPQVLIKVGDGVNKFKDLPYITAKAGDVYAWAKQEKPSYIKAVDSTTGTVTYGDASADILALLGDVANLKTFQNGNAQVIANAIQEAKNYTNAEIQKLIHTTVEEDDNKTGNVVTNVTQANGIVTVTKGTLAIGDLENGTETISGITGRLDNLETKVNTNIPNTYATKEELNAAKQALSGEIDSDIATARGLITDEIDGDIATAKTELVGAAGTENTILWAKNAADNALSVANGKVAQDEYDDKIELIDAKDEEQDGRLDDLEEQITGLTGAMHFKGVVNTDPTAEGFDISGYESGDVVIFGNKEYVFHIPESQENGAFVEFGDAEVNAGAIAGLNTRVEAIEKAPYATEEDVTKAKEALIGVSGDDANKDTIYGAKAYAEGQAAAVLGTAANATAGDATVHGALKAAAAADTKAGNAATAAATADEKAVKAQEEVDALEKLVGEKADADTVDTAFGRIAKAQKEVDALEELVGDAADTKDDATVYGAIAAEKARAEQAEGNLQTQINTINQNKTTVSTTENAGLKVTPNGNDYKVDIDDTVTFIFNCGSSADLDPAQA